MSINGDFLNLYNRLDSMLRYLVDGQEGKNYIFFYEKILPYDKRPRMEEIRHFKNSHKSHGVSNNDQPIASRSWIAFLQDQIRFVDNNRSLVKEKMLQIIEQFKDKKGNNSRSPRNTNYTPKSVEQSFTRYPFPKWNINIGRFMFYDYILDNNDSRWIDDLYRLTDMITLLARFEHFIGPKGEITFPDNAELKWEEVRFGSEFVSDDFVSKKPPLESDAKVLYTTVKLSNPNKRLWVFFNTLYNSSGSIILCEGEPDGYYSNNWILKCCGLYYFKRDYNSCVFCKMLAGKDVHLKTAKKK